MTANKKAQTKTTDDEEEIGVEDFTPDQEAALDKAAKSEPVVVKEPVVVAEKDDEPSAAEQIESLKKQVADSNARADSEEKKRRELEKKQVSSIDDMEAAEQGRVKLAEEKLATDLELANRDVTELRRKLREAKENGDLDKEDEINDKLLDAKIKQKQITDAKDGFEKWKASRPAVWDDARKKAEKKVNSADEIPFNESDFTPKALEWINEHPQFKTDKVFNTKAIRAHHAAVGEGIEEDSEEYFQFLNKRLGLTDAGEATEADKEAEAKAKKEAAVEVVEEQPKPKKIQTQLPPSRSGGGQVRQEGNRIKKLTAAEVEAAQISGMTNEEYWDDKYGTNRD